MSGANESLRRQISGAGDLEGVVRAMKALAASSIGQYERAVQSLDEYYRAVELGLSVCLRQAGPASVASPARSGPIGAILFGSDQGLVGRFNEVLVEFALRELKALPGVKTKIWAVGERIGMLLADTDLPEAVLLPAPISIDAITPLIGRLLLAVEAAREQGAVHEIYVFHNHPVSGAGYEPVRRRLLPLDDKWHNKLATIPWGTKQLPEVIGDAAATLQAFIRGYLFVLLFQACAESLASENASRLTAMQRAEKNIKDILEDLSRTFHRIRQESIDEELFDVVSGFDALPKR
jgi:F-type H+-transporting ATPase subunit gamma